MTPAPPHVPAPSSDRPKASFVEKLRQVRERDAEIRAWPIAARVRVLRNYTIENLGPLVRYECARDRIAADVSFCDFDAFEQEVVDPASVTNATNPDIVLVSLWLDGLLESSERAAFDVPQVYDRCARLLDTLASRVSSTIIVTTILPPFFALGGAGQVRHDVAVRACVADLNARLLAYASTAPRVHAVDLTRLVARVGERAAFDPRFWYLYRAPLRNELLELLAEELGVVVRSLKGGAKKVLVLDCDNTLWGGIVGEDGVDGIALDAVSYPGSAFRDFHRQIVALKERGVMLALASKNNDADVMAVLDGHHDAGNAADPVGSALAKIVRALPESVAAQAARVVAGVAELCFIPTVSCWLYGRPASAWVKPPVRDSVSMH